MKTTREIIDIQRLYPLEMSKETTEHKWNKPN